MEFASNFKSFKAKYLNEEDEDDILCKEYQYHAVTGKLYSWGVVIIILIMNEVIIILFKYLRSKVGYHYLTDELSS